jgi:hypothetical protein
MRLKALPSFLAALLIVACAISAGGLVYHMPVVVQSSVAPGVLMPGDSGVLTLILENGAASYGAGNEFTRGEVTVSTPVNGTRLLGTEEISVHTKDYTDIGMIGPSDKIALYYNIKADENTSNGTYFLDFTVWGGYDSIIISRKIPIKVDSAGVGLSRADSSKGKSMSLNVANPRQNTINAVTVAPKSPGLIFSPEQYYVGTMEPDEVFTISFSIESENPKTARPQSNISYLTLFKNGDTWHESGPYNATYRPPMETESSGWLVPVLALVLVLLLISGGILYKRRSKAKKGNGAVN